MPVRRSACALPDAIATGSSVGCLPRSFARVLLSRGAAGGETRALAALVRCLLAGVLAYSLVFGELRVYLPVLSADFYR